MAQQHPDSVAALLERHHLILKQAIEAHGGYIFQIIGDAFCAAFQTVREALEGALDAQLSLSAENWSPEPIRVRMGISTGSARIRYQEDRPSDYSGYLSLAHVQRVMSVAHGGQILLANASAQLVRAELPPNINLRDLGEYRLKGLQNPEYLWQVVAPGLQPDFPPLVSLYATPNNLPLQLTSFVGRQHEIADVKKLMETHRLITLTGSGGTGKTRLALQIAAEVLDQFRDGTWLVELAPVREGLLIPQTALRILGLLTEAGRQPLDILTEYLSSKSLLIILDNCEHLLPECCFFVQAILQAASAVKVLATSREALNLTGEQAYRVPSLRIPDADHLPSVEQLTQFEAVHLFTERAALVSSGFGVTGSNAHAIAQICQRLDGIPLAIELAAARVKSMPLAALVSRLDDRFRLLTGGSRNALPRQQTLRATIDWSYALLTEAEKSLLQRLSVFRGGWTLEAAEAVCSGDGLDELEVLDLLSRLVGKSLLSLDESGRYQMLETVRQYAGERLIDSGQAERGRDRHLKFLLDLAERAEPGMRDEHQVMWLDRLDPELDNLRAALAWSQDRDAQLFLRLASAAWRFFSIRVAHDEAIERLQEALGRTEDWPSTARAQALSRLAFLYGSSGDYKKLAEPFARQGYELSARLEDKPSMAMALATLSLCQIYNDPAAAISSAKQALKISREIGDHWLAVYALWSLAQEAISRNDLTAGTSFMEEALIDLHLLGDNRFVTNCLSLLSRINRAQGNAIQAERLAEEAVSVAKAMGDRENTGGYLLDLALAAILSEDYPRAEQLLEEAFALAKAVNSRLGIALALMDYAVLESARGNGSAVCEQAQALISMARQVNDPVVAAQALSLLGEGYRLQEETEMAKVHYNESLIASRQEGFRQGYCHALQGLGALALGRGQVERAVRLFAARAKLRERVFAEDYYPFMVRERERWLAEARSQLDEEAFKSAWAAGQAMTEEEMLAYALTDSYDD